MRLVLLAFAGVGASRSQFSLRTSVMHSETFTSNAETNRYVAVSLSPDGTECLFSSTPQPEAVVIAQYEPSVNTTGWGILAVNSANTVGWTPAQTAFAAGCAEAAVTAEEMWAYWTNYAAAEYSSGTPGTKLTTFMSSQLTWIRQQLDNATNFASNDSTSTFWTGVGQIMAQFDGLVYYHAHYAPQQFRLDELTIYFLNSVGDLEDLNGLFAGSSTTTRSAGGVHSKFDPIPTVDKLTDCSASINTVPDLSDVVMGHTTWRYYYAMLRIYKVYQLDFLPAGVVSFSSSPGLLHSKDDFYTTRQLVVMETTNSVFNRTLFDLYITPQSAFTWQRAYAANGWAQSGEEWTSLFAMHNSGCYNNQWMIVDAAMFTPGQLPQPGFLWIIEQIPGYVHAQDVTSVLNQQGYWASYNIPYEQDIFDMSGYPAMVEKYGDSYTYDNCSRANIFRRNATDVVDLPSVRALLRYNNFQHDPLSGGDPILGSVSSRGDLRSAPAVPVPFGGVDTKVIAWSSMGEGGNLEVWAESGPTHDQQVPFAWADFPQFVNVSRVLVPAVFDFPTIAIALHQE